MKRQLELKDFRYFIALGEELHFRRAARRLRVPQPHLSVHIRKLEEQLGVRLLERTTRSVKLTAAGGQFLERARYSVAQIEQAVLSTQHYAKGRNSRLRLAYTPSATFHGLPRILSEFRELCPDADVALTCMETARQISALLDGRVHFGLLRPPEHSCGLNIQLIDRERVIVALPKSHPLTSKPSLGIADLAEERFIHFSPGSGVDFQEHVVAYCRRAGFIPRTAFEAPDTASVLTLVAAEFGVAIVPEWVMHAPAVACSFRALPDLPPLVDLALAWTSDTACALADSFRSVVHKHVAIERNAPLQNDPVSTPSGASSCRDS
jgi:DNA-binding transcriptional LysR family regulator